MMKWIRLISRLLVGALFVFSGYVKGIDPLGSTYKFIDYFDAFNMGALRSISFPLAILLCTAEFIIGVSLLLNLRMKTASWYALCFMGFFTILTFILALTNPVTDCGCFGDAWILSNWETFWKNIIISFFTIIIFVQRDKYENSLRASTQWLVVLFFVIAFISFSIYNLKHLRIVEFRPYKVGVNIAEGMKVPDGAGFDVYKTIFYYKDINTGKVKKFDEKNYPWQDTANWEFVSYENKLVEKGFKPSIYNFSITSGEGEDLTEAIISDTNYSFLFIAYNLVEADIDGIKKGNELARFAAENENFNFYCLTASPESHIKRLKKRVDVNFDCYSSDEITLKTIIRANPGLMLIKDGNILAKWHYRDIPDINTFNKNYIATVLAEKHKKEANMKNMLFVAVLLLLFSSISLFKYKLCKK
jgi:hypothetical protein